MELKGILKRFTNMLLKYKYAFLVLAIGLMLMSIPSIGTQTDTTNEEIAAEPASEETPEERLSKILCCIDGAGDVQVMLTKSKGEETVYQTNEDISSGSESGSTKVDTVTVTDSSRNQNGLIRQINPPQYLGAIVVCRGADDPSVRLAIVDAVSKVTGLGANQISVLKMK